MIPYLRDSRSIPSEHTDPRRNKVSITQSTGYAGARRSLALMPLTMNSVRLMQTITKVAVILTTL